MQDAYHAARLVALQSALLSLLSEQVEGPHKVDAITVTLSTLDQGIHAIDLIYTHHGQPVAGEGF